MTHAAHPPFSHRQHSNTGCHPDGPHFSSLKDFFELCNNLGSIWHQGADTKMSLVSGGEVILRPEINYFSLMLFENSNKYSPMVVEKRHHTIEDIILLQWHEKNIFIFQVNSFQHSADAGCLVKTLTEGWVCKVCYISNFWSSRKFYFWYDFNLKCILL